jgi:flagellar hook assembly protein FlgD
VHVRRLVQVVTALVVAATPVAVGGAPAEAGPAYQISAPEAFSPNGDGVQETLRVRFTVPKPTQVSIEVSRYKSGRVLRSADLGWTNGSGAWTWDGRNDQGNRVGAGTYSITLRKPDGRSIAGTGTKVDNRFKPTLTTRAFGVENPQARVFPRSTDVTDVIELTAFSHEERLSSMSVVIRNARGKVVRDAKADTPLLGAGDRQYGWGGTVPWAAQRGGKPLPKGRYTAVATGRDGAGNVGHSDPLRIWVSADKLVWKEVSTTVPAAEAEAFGYCTYDGGPGCSDFQPCGTVRPSAVFAGGLSYRSAVCATPTGYNASEAVASYLMQYPEAAGLRGLGAARVSFTGAATTAGGADTGTLSVWNDGPEVSVVGTSGQSAWAERPWWREGALGDPGTDIPDRAPAAAWSFRTTGTDSVDVASFTVDARYLVVAD